MKKKSKIISLMLTLAFMVMLWPGVALAEDDTTPPEWKDNFPEAVSVSDKEFSLHVGGNEAGTAYFVRLEDGAYPPSAVQVAAGQDASGNLLSSPQAGSFHVNAVGTSSIRVRGLMPDTSYDVYAVLKDEAGNLQENPTLVEVTTTVPSGTDSGITKVESGVPGWKKVTVYVTVKNVDGIGSRGYSDADFSVKVDDTPMTFASDPPFSGFWASDSLQEPNNGLYYVVFTGNADNTEYTLTDLTVAGVVIEAGPYEIKTPPPALAAPTDLAWDDTTPGKATWGAVTDAVSYRVQLFKGVTQQGSEIKDLSGTEHDFTSAIEAAGDGIYTFRVTAIGDGTNYGNSQMSAASPGYDYTATADTTPPAFVDETPKLFPVTDPGRRQVSLSVKPDETVTVYYVVLPKGADAPDVAEVIEGTGSGGSTPAAKGNSTNVDTGGISIGILLPEHDTEYDIYVAMEDAAGNTVMSDKELSFSISPAADIFAADHPVEGAKEPAGSKRIKVDLKTIINAHVFYVVVPDNDPVPSFSEILNMKASGYATPLDSGVKAIAADASDSITTIALPDDNKPYDVYLVAVPATEGGGIDYTINSRKVRLDVTTPLPADKTDLIAAIEAIEYVAVSTDGSDVKSTDKWTTEEDKTTLEDAVADAQAVVDNADATQQQVEDAVTALATAVSEYEAAQQYGTAVYAFDVLVDSGVAQVYSYWAEYSVCNGLLVYVEKESKTEAVEMSFTPGANGGGVYDVTLDVAYPGSGYSYLDILFSEVPTVPSEISLTSGDAFTLDEAYSDQYNSESTGEGVTYYSLYQGFEFEGLEPGGQLNATFTATLPRSDGEPVERTINLTVRHNPDLFPATDFSKLLGTRDDLYPADIWQGVMFSDSNDWLTSEQVLSGTVNGYRAFAVKADSYVDVALAFETSEYDKIIFWDLYDSTGELFDDDYYYEIVNELIGESGVTGYCSDRTEEIYTSSDLGPWLLVATNIKGDYLPIVLSLTDESDEGELVLPEWQAVWDDIIAGYEAAYTVTIIGGGSGASGAGQHVVGDTVNINAGSRSGYTFNGWTSDDVTIINSSNKNASFTMPANDVIVTANWKRTSSGGGGGRVVTPAVTGVKIKTAPDKVSYTQGDELDLTGLKVTLTYSNGTTKDIALADFADNKITVSPKAGDVLDVDDKEIVITVNGKTVKLPITVEEDTTVIPPPAEKPVLTDISGHWAKASIEHLVEMGAISGYPDNTFRPDNLITRAEFATVLVKAMGLPATGSKVFADTEGHWAKEAISTAYAAGIISGYNEQNFGPDDPITREQMAVMVAKAAGLTGAAPELEYADSQQISAWAREFVARAAAEKLISGYPDNTFRPANNATRAEAVTVISQKW